MRELGPLYSLCAWSFCGEVFLCSRGNKTWRESLFLSPDGSMQGSTTKSTKHMQFHFLWRKCHVLLQRNEFTVCTPFFVAYPPTSFVLGLEISRIVKRTISRLKCCILPNRHENTYCIVWMIQIKWLGLQTKNSATVPSELGIFLLWTKLSVGCCSSDVLMDSHLRVSQRSSSEPSFLGLFYSVSSFAYGSLITYKKIVLLLKHTHAWTQACMCTYTDRLFPILLNLLIWKDNINKNNKKDENQITIIWLWRRKPIYHWRRSCIVFMWVICVFIQ